jgi:hypothetical protein
MRLSRNVKLEEVGPSPSLPTKRESDATKPDYGTVIITLAEAFNVKLVPSSTTVFTLRSRDDLKAWEDYRDRKRKIGEMPKVNVDCRPRDPELGPDKGCPTCVFSKDEDVYVYYMMLAVVHEVGGIMANLLAHSHITTAYACDTFSQVTRGYVYVHEQGCAPRKNVFVFGKSCDKDRTSSIALVVPNPKESARKELCACCDRLIRKNLWCSGCTDKPKAEWVAYCNAECQRKAWSQHKLVCGGVKEKMKTNK